MKILFQLFTLGHLYTVLLSFKVQGKDWGVWWWVNMCLCHIWFWHELYIREIMCSFCWKIKGILVL
jgi:hypothetical protein